MICPRCGLEGEPWGRPDVVIPLFNTVRLWEPQELDMIAPLRTTHIRVNPNWCIACIKVLARLRQEQIGGGRELPLPEQRYGER